MFSYRPVLVGLGLKIIVDNFLGRGFVMVPSTPPIDVVSWFVIDSLCRQLVSDGLLVASRASNLLMRLPSRAFVPVRAGFSDGIIGLIFWED